MFDYAVYNYLFKSVLFFFFFNDTATTEIYTLSLHDALPICRAVVFENAADLAHRIDSDDLDVTADDILVLKNIGRSEEHTSELQSRLHLVCRLLLEKKKIK